MPKNEFVCDCHPIDQALVERAKNALPDSTALHNLSAFFSMIGDPTRCKILLALKETPLCVCDLANVLSMTKSSVSHQLNKMKNAGIVKCQRSGKQVFYALDDHHVLEVFEISMVHTKHKWEEKEHEK